MSRPAAAMNPGQTNRRFILLAIVLGLLGAILVYVAFSREKTSPTGGVSDTPVVVAKQDIPARTKITESMVEIRLVAADNRSTLTYSDVAAVAGLITRFPIAANEQVLSNKVIPLTSTGASTQRSLSFVVPPGMRGIAVTVKEVTTAGGLLLPGDYVDILVVYDIDFQDKPGDPASRTKVDSYLIQTLFQGVEVLAVSQITVDLVPETTPTANGQRGRNTEAKPDKEAITVTLSLSPEDAQKLYLAESNGRLRFTVRRFGDDEIRPLRPMVETDLFQNVPNPFFSR